MMPGPGTSTDVATPSGANGNGAGADMIRTDKLSKTYAGTDFKAVDELDMVVTAGEIFGLLGPNGAGKTTTAGMLTTRVIPTSGHAYVGGVDVVAHPALAKQLQGVVSQQNTLDRQLTCWENLYYHGRLFGVPARRSRERADQLLEQFQLARWSKASVYALSGGMAQRLMVARSIFHRPAVLFMDEPTSGLDPQSRLALWEILGELNRDGQTIVLMTHYMEEADRLCDRVAIMDHGRFLALGTPASLKAGVGADSIVTVKVAGDPAGLAAVLGQEIEGATRARQVDGGAEVHVSGSSGVLPAVIAITERRGDKLLDVAVAEPTLETVFINLTGKNLRD
jgi:ABC-2 type transport system ATP-binding protein